MPTLDYAQFRPKYSRRVIRGLFAAIVLVSMIVTAWELARWYRQWQVARLAGAYRLIDAKIPGTQVYFRGKLLGTTPLMLSKSQCAALGLPVSPGTVVDGDGWGEGVLFHERGMSSDPRLMYKVPSNRAGAFLTYETPWGLRTKQDGGRDLPNGFRSLFMPRGQNGIGVIVKIEFNSKPAPTEKQLKVKVSVSNNGSLAYSGFRPEIELLWGTFDVQWQHRFHKTFKLPAEWANIAPGQTLQTSVDIPLPAAAGDYSVFATLNVFRNEKDDTLVGHGSVYSDSKLLRVR